LEPQGQQREPASPPGEESAATQRKLSNLLARGQLIQALRVREQALRRHPHWRLSSSEAELWCLEGRQTFEQGQPQRAEAAFARARALLAEAFTSGQLGAELAGIYLKLLLLHGEEQQVRTLLREQPHRFQSQQIHWAAGVLALLEGNSAHALRQFKGMLAPASPGDYTAVWRAWALALDRAAQHWLQPPAEPRPRRWWSWLRRRRGDRPDPHPAAGGAAGPWPAVVRQRRAAL
jgi:tetratricopeptide (TPR) repeat protein